jgi:hypothetical protein
MRELKTGLFIGYLVALSLVFASCDKDNGLENKEISGQEVAVRIRSFGIADGGSENVTRASLQGKSEMIATPVGDGMLLEMSIKEDESPLRKTELTNGAYFRVIAVKVGTTEYYSHGDFVYGNPISLLTDFHVKIGEAYDYICFSYNETTNTLPSSASYSAGVAVPTSLNMSATKDPLWCKITGLGTVLSTGVELDITMKHLLAKVKVKVDCAYNGWEITSVAADQVAVVAVNPALSCAIDWKTGIISGTDMDKGLTYTISDATRTDQTSNEAALVPKGSNVTVVFKANAISRNGLTAVPSFRVEASLDKVLDGGVSYTIHIRLRTPKFAGSNIYWVSTGTNTGYLTFDEYYENGSTAPHKGYQGVFFKWGSLVGISPVGDFGYTIPLYVPYGYSSDPKWKKTNGNAIAADGTIPYASNWTAWGDIPYWDSGHGSPTEFYNTYMLDPERNNLAAYQGLRGDICQYLSTKTGVVSGDYRLPMPWEFGYSSYTDGVAGYVHEGWSRNGNFVAQTSNKDDGTYNSASLSYAQNGTMGGVVFPTSGNRPSYVYQGAAFSATHLGQNGFYWTCSSPVNANNGRFFYFGERMVHASGLGAEGNYPAVSVRCVMN